MRTRLSRTVVAALAALAAVLAVLAPAPSASAATQPILFGLYDHTDADRHATEAALGKRAALAGYFTAWTASFPSTAYLQREVRNYGGVPVLTWAPNGLGYHPLGKILNGSQDKVIANYARGAKAYGHPVMIRLMAEMNGTWEQYYPGGNGNRLGEFIPAWQRIVKIFRANGATNVLWVWSPNRFYSGQPNWKYLYPGDAYVNWVGLDIYNYGLKSHGGWLWFPTMMGPSLKALRAVAPRKPLMVAEVGCNNSSLKPNWIKDMYARLPGYGVKAVMYFDESRPSDDNVDWRLTTIAANRTAARYAVSQYPIKGGNQLPLSVTERYLVRGYY